MSEFNPNFQSTATCYLSQSAVHSRKSGETTQDLLLRLSDEHIGMDPNAFVDRYLFPVRLGQIPHGEANQMPRNNDIILENGLVCSIISKERGDQQIKDLHHKNKVPLPEGENEFVFLPKCPSIWIERMASVGSEPEEKEQSESSESASTSASEQVSGFGSESTSESTHQTSSEQAPEPSSDPNHVFPITEEVPVGNDGETITIQGDITPEEKKKVLGIFF